MIGTITRAAPGSAQFIALAILLTLIVRGVMFPIANKQFASMAQMKAIQPKMKAIQERYKDDKQKMQQAMMELYQKEKINPVAGCLPLLLQIPVFIGFYRMIQFAIELRGEPFLWIADLSKADTLFHIPGLGWPFNLMPLLMGLTMLWQARLQPAAPGMDPLQQKMMKYMPLMFLVILYNFSAGLTLYWTVQNLISILQMKLTKTQEEAAPAPTKVPTPAPVKEARMRRKN